ncbi:MAG: hypothetical protein IKJ60_04265 [Ruminococcus sp.]|nr:hypothetical protein [Ruminococcus sp.]
MKKRLLSAILSMATAVSSVTAIASNASDERVKLSESVVERYRDKGYQVLDGEKYNCVNFVNSDYLFMEKPKSSSGRIEVVQYKHDGDLVQFEFDSTMNENDFNEIIEQIKSLDKEFEINASKYTFFVRIRKENITPDVAKKIREIAGDKAVNFRYLRDVYDGMELTVDYITGYDIWSCINVVERKEGDRIYTECDTVSNRDVLEEYAEKHSDVVEFNAYDGVGDNFLGYETGMPLFYLIPKKELSVMEHLELAEDIYKETGVKPFAYELQTGSAGGSVGAELDLTDYLDGDANRDKITTIADAAAIFQSLANPDKYKLSAQGEFNADSKGDGITVDDAVRIQKKLAGITE